MTDGRPGTGRLGEALARRHFERRGARILAERHRSRLGEIDLVVEEGGVIVFVEVKTRRSRSFGPPEEAVTPAKQARLGRLAAEYLASRGLAGRDCRFDVVAVEAGDGKAQLRHVVDAFRL